MAKMVSQYYEAQEVYELIREINLREPVLGGSSEFQELVSVALSFLPAETVDQAVKGCVYFEFTGPVSGKHFFGGDFADKSLVVLYIDKIEENAEWGWIIIMHETAHYILKHRWMISRTPEETKKYENETELDADSLVTEWLSMYADHHPEQKELVEGLIRLAELISHRENKMKGR